MIFRDFTISNFICCECNARGIPISRKKNQRRGYLHYKKLYCIYCKKETNHIEIRDIDDSKEIINKLIKIKEI